MRLLEQIRGGLQTGWVHQNIAIGCAVGLLALGIGGYTVWTLNQESDSPTGVTMRQHTNIHDANLLTGQWSYLSGSSREDDGLRIKPVDFTIVEQDGSGGQTNPPINLYGTHLERATEFQIAATMRGLQGGASMQLYGQPPIIADEFRIERESVRVTLHGAKLSVSIWDGNNQMPVAMHAFDLPTDTDDQKSIELGIAHQDDTLRFAINNQVIGEVPAQSVFRKQSVWFGFDAEQDDWLLTSLTAHGMNGRTFSVVDGATLHVAPDADSLQRLAAEKRDGFTVGAALALPYAMSDPAYARAAFGGTFGALTPENALKWQVVEPKRDTFSFAEGDALVSLAKRHDMKVQGHTLVFGEANPRWVQELPKDQVEAVMLEHIKKVVTHYKGDMWTWDVVNEPFDDEEWSELRQHVWYRAMGEDYIAKAFKAAHAADPNALLFINEYGLEEDGDRWEAMLALVTRLKKQGVPIDGVGFQAHVYEAGDKIDAAVLREHIRELADRGLKSRVSEMDVYDDDGTAVQSQQYKDIFLACLSEPNCISWTTWGVSDRYDFFKDDDGSIQQGHDYLWSTDMKPTAPLTTLLEALRK
jgi:endo-1,4-beta-xylanase